MATGSNRFLQFAKQSVPRTLPSPAIFHRLRNTGGSGLINNRTNITSNEIRSDRQIIENRLGQNQPDVSIPFELSYDSFDQLMEGALGSAWIGGRRFTVSATVDTGGIFTLASGSWEDYEINVGDYVIIQGTANTDVFGYVGALSYGSPDELTVYGVVSEAAITTVAEGAVDFEFITGHYSEAIDTSSNTITVSATASTIVRATGSWATLGVEIGDFLYFAGFAQSANNGWHRVETVTATTLTLRDAELTDETLSSGTLEVGTSTGFLTSGTDMSYFAFEEGFTDIDTGLDSDGESVIDGLFHYILGCYVNSWSLNIQPDAMLTGDFAFQGLLYSGFKNETAANSYEQTNTNGVFDSFTGNLSIPDAPEIQSVITGLNFSLDNSLVRRYSLMDKDAISIGEGRVNVSGSLNAYFANASVSNLFETETALEISIRTEDIVGNSFTFGWPKVKLTSDSRDVSESDVTQTLNFAALGGTATDKKKTMYILRQPFTEA